MPGMVDGLLWSSRKITCTLRPSSPPLALTSSSQSLIASNDTLPLGPSPPVIAMLEPILIGAACPRTVVEKCGAASAARPSFPAVRRVISLVILPPPYETRFFFDCRHFREDGGSPFGCVSGPPWRPHR